MKWCVDRNFKFSNSYILVSYLNLAGYTLLAETDLMNVNATDNREERNVGDARISGQDIWPYLKERFISKLQKINALLY